MRGSFYDAGFSWQSGVWVTTRSQVQASCFTLEPRYTDQRGQGGPKTAEMEYPEGQDPLFFVMFDNEGLWNKVTKTQS